MRKVRRRSLPSCRLRASTKSGKILCRNISNGAVSRKKEVSFVVMAPMTLRLRAPVPSAVTLSSNSL
jgi:hypothetical protein